jgi:putative DNA primase/helicase
VIGEPITDARIQDLAQGHRPSDWRTLDEIRHGGDHHDGDVGDHDVDHQGQAHPLTDIANGERFVDQHGENVRYNADWKRWLVWDGRRWREDAVGVEAMAKQTAIAIWDEAKAANSTVTAAWAVRSQSISGVRGTLEMAHSEAPVVVRTKDLDTDPWLLNTPSGTIDLRAGEQSPARRKDLIMKITAAKFDPEAKCPRWERFLEEVFTKSDFTTDHDLIDYIRRLVGYGLTGSVREHIFAVLYGTGRNGKSVFLNTVRYALGDYGGTTAADLLLAKRSEVHPTGLANLYGRRVVVSAETDAGRRLDESLVKDITGADPIPARRMHEDWWEFDPTFKLLLATNHKPVIRGTDEGIWRRIHLVPFNRTIDAADQDDGLEQKLRVEWPGILAWAVRGCLEWQEGGLRPPAAVVEATRSYREESDAIRRFIDDRCECLSGAEVRTGVLFAVYQSWCESEGEKPVSSAAFSTDLTTRGFPGDTASFSGKTARIRRHIRLADEP